MFEEEEELYEMPDEFEEPNDDELAMEAAMFDDLEHGDGLDNGDGAAEGGEPTAERDFAASEEAEAGPPESAPVPLAEERTALASFSVPGSSQPLRLLARATAKRGTARRPPPAGSLLGKPFGQLMDALDRERVAEAKLAALEAEKPPPRKPSGGVVASQLWVDKYRPRSFTELLSDERVNRRVLRWVKAWDPHVFPSTRRPGAKLSRGGAASAEGKPECLIMLISGPPGLGKTTLVHVIAKHCGYRAVEINASDERTSKVLRQRVKEATETQAAFSDDRPPLIILDEIDGALGGTEGQGAVNELVKLATVKTARDGTATSLQRPVICICNNLHAPALRPLRAIAEQVELREAGTAQIVTRLRHICDREKMTAPTNVLATLAQRSGHDVRTCLNTLQFIRSKTDTLSDEVLEAVAVGRKDTGKSALSLWKQTFLSAASRRELTPRGAAAASTHSELLGALSHADVPRVVDGVAENYLGMGYADPLLARTAESADWLSFDDVATEAQFSKGHFALMAYHAFAVLAVHEQCAVPHVKEPIEWPRSASNHRKALQQRRQILCSWHSAMEAQLFNRYTASDLLVDVLTPLLVLLSPPISSSMVHVLNSKEKQCLHDLIDHMISFGLSFQQVLVDDGSYAHQLEPPIATLLPSSQPLADASVRGLPPPIKQYVATELLRELLRRQHGASSHAPPPRDEPPPTPHAPAKEAAARLHGAAAARKDLFGRPIVDNARKRAAPAPATGPVFRFKYHEGVTDAVRRTVRVRDLL